MQHKNLDKVELGDALDADKPISKAVINTSELGRHIKRKREELRMSLRAVAQVTGVSAATLSRIENGTVQPDADNLARLAQWLNIPMERVITDGGTRAMAAGAGDGLPVVYFPQESVPDIVEAHLRADRNLTPETARALSELFRVAYSQFSIPAVQSNTGRQPKE